MPSIGRRSLLQAALAIVGAIANLLPTRLVRAQPSPPAPGGMMGSGMGDMMGPMRLGMELFQRHTAIRRNVNVLPNGIRAVTESDDPEVAALIQAHVGDMYARIDQDRPFAYPMSRTVPVLFRNIDRYHRQLEVTAKGVAVTETASDANMIELIKAHAQEISGFVAEGMPAMMRGMGP